MSCRDPDPEAIRSLLLETDRRIAAGDLPEEERLALGRQRAQVSNALHRVEMQEKRRSVW